jgi:toxin ParE1/3/4
MSYALHPEAAMEYAEQVAHYKSLRESLGKCFHAAVKAAASKASAAPYRYHVEHPPAIRRIPVDGFPYSLIFREIRGNVQVLAIAHHRRRPLYWLGRI